MAVTFKFINPEPLGPPSGYSNGVMADAGGRLLFVAGQVGWDANQQIVGGDMVAQFDRALANVIKVITEAGGRPDQIAKMVIYVTDRVEYLESRRRIGERYRAQVGKHFPAMVLVEVKSLLDEHATVEIEAVAVLDS